MIRWCAVSPFKPGRLLWTWSGASQQNDGVNCCSTTLEQVWDTLPRSDVCPSSSASSPSQLSLLLATVAGEEPFWHPTSPCTVIKMWTPVKRQRWSERVLSGVKVRGQTEWDVSQVRIFVTLQVTVSLHNSVPVPPLHHLACGDVFSPELLIPVDLLWVDTMLSAKWIWLKKTPNNTQTYILPYYTLCLILPLCLAHYKPPKHPNAHLAGLYGSSGIFWYLPERWLGRGLLKKSKCKPRHCTVLRPTQARISQVEVVSPLHRIFKSF